MARGIAPLSVGRKRTRRSTHPRGSRTDRLPRFARAAVAAIAAIAILAGCGGASTKPPRRESGPPGLIDITRTTRETTGIEGRIVAVSGNIVTVTGRVVARDGNPAGPLVMRPVKTWRTDMRVGDRVFLATGADGRLAIDKAAERREGVAQP